MTLPEFLSLRDVEAWMLQVGLYVERHQVARALRLVPLEGVIAPGRRGQRWTVPKAQLLNLLVACFARRAGGGAVPVSFDRVYLDAAEHLMRDDPDLARMMPPSLKKAVRERQKARKSRSSLFGCRGRAAAGSAPGEPGRLRGAAAAGSGVTIQMCQDPAQAVATLVLSAQPR
jgi:hypothetical protein